MALPLIKGMLILWCVLPWFGVSAAPVNSGNVEAELISEVSSIRPGESFWVALKQKIRPGWHTYWRNPGDSGAPTKLEWNLPAGFSASDIHWPYPERVPYGPLMNFGYHDEVVFPVLITVPDHVPGNEVSLQAKGQWLVCADICIPESADLELVLPVSDGKPVAVAKHVEDFENARQKIPQDIGVIAESTFEADVIWLHVAMSGLQASRIRSIEYFPYEEGVLDFPSPQVLSFTDAGFKLELRAGYNFQPIEPKLDGILVVTEDAGGMLRTAFEVSPLVAGGAVKSDISLSVAVLFAFLGGLILNLMPCVFPVLSIKILSLVESSHADPGAIKHHGIAYMVGVVLSFLVVAAILIVLRAGGEQIGWGFQLQSPIVVGLLVYLFALIGLNLSGYFEFGTSLMNAGGGLASRSGYSGSFSTGVLAALVAAPCTAPFMGAAIGYALTRDAISALLIFTSLGLGMALPYVLLCFSPALLKRMPKPGRWMETLKEIFAFPMFATAIWLMWVLNLQTGADGLLAILSGLLLIAFALWLLRRRGQGAGRVIANMVIMLLLISALGLTGMVSNSTASLDKAGPAEVEISGLRSEPYSRERLKTLVAEGPVFVNFTAAWCITCKVNDLAALSSDRVGQVFADHDIRYLKADWTNEDPAITRALAEYGRSGVPLYLLYPKGNFTAKVLPQILTESIVIEAIEAL